MMVLTHTKYSIKGGFCVLVCLLSWASQVAQWERICLPMQKIQVRSLGQKDPLEKEMATHFSILAWKLPWTGEPGRLQTTGMQSWTRLGQRRSTAQQHQLLSLRISLWKIKAVLPPHAASTMSLVSCYLCYICITFHTFHKLG